MPRSAILIEIRGGFAGDRSSVLSGGIETRRNDVSCFNKGENGESIGVGGGAGGEGMEGDSVVDIERDVVEVDLS